MFLRRSFAVEELSFVCRHLCSQGIVVGILAVVLSKNKRSRCLVGFSRGGQEPGAWLGGIVEPTLLLTCCLRCLRPEQERFGLFAESTDAADLPRDAAPLSFVEPITFSHHFCQAPRLKEKRQE